MEKIGGNEARILLVRHGESLGNLKRTFLGHMDLDLTEKGYAQGRRVCEYICHRYEVDEIRASDLARAWHTVEPLARQLGLPLQKDAALREIGAGCWEGMRVDDIKTIYCEAHNVWSTRIGMSRPTGGESAAELRARISAALHRIAWENLTLTHEKKDGRTVCIGTHAGAIRLFISEVRGLPLERAHEVPWAPNASVTELIFDKNGTVREIEYGKDDYLRELRGPSPSVDGLPSDRH